MEKWLKYLYKSYNYKKNSDFEVILLINNNEILINLKSLKFSIKNFKNYSRKNIFDLSKKENWSVLLLICYLLKKNYTLDELVLEKSWQLGHKNRSYVDVTILKNNLPYYIFEVKEFNKLDEYISLKNKTKTLQLISYLFQQKTIKIGSYFSFDIDQEKQYFYSILINKKLIEAFSVDDFYDKWTKNWNKFNYLENNKFTLSSNVLSYSDLENIDEHSVKKIFNQLLTIFRLYSVSDKSNAFNKIINIFIAKVYDELCQNQNFKVKENTVSGVKFQYIYALDDELSFLKRLNDLYTLGMREYMDKNVIDYNDEEINILLNSKNNKKLLKIIDNLRLKKNNVFSFIEVFDEESFLENNNILKEVVMVLQNYRFKYNQKHQYLGDFFEELLNTTWKQEAGQFFTPLPLVEFMVEALPIKEKILSNIFENKKNILPKMIDYACGSGHFLLSYMNKVQNIVKTIDEKGFTTFQKNLLKAYRANPYNWAKEYVVGIEKDYRLSKTTKIASFLNGDGEALILNANGLTPFTSKVFSKTLLFKNSNKNEIFDFVIANPPFSISGFLKTLATEKLSSSDFSLLKYMSYTSKEIEVLFVERAWQLLKNGGFASIILPRSVLSGIQYVCLREFILKNFKVIAIFESGDNTFSGTTTSPIILFLEKKEVKQLMYKLLVINSPKLLFEEKNKTKKEAIFLGYKFSSNKNNLGIVNLNKNLVEIYSKKIKSFLLKEKIETNNYCFIKNIDDILVKNSKNNINIYTKFTKQKDPKQWFILKDLDIEWNPKTAFSGSNSKLKYIEIRNLSKNKISFLKAQNKKTVNRFCKKNDLLISPFPNSEKIAIADQDYFVSSAIFILRFKKLEEMKKVYQYLKENKNNIIGQMTTLLDGFKISYAKISEYNFKNYIYFKKKDF